jgi:hypothetical protein
MKINEDGKYDLGIEDRQIFETLCSLNGSK